MQKCPRDQLGRFALSLSSFFENFNALTSSPPPWKNFCVRPWVLIQGGGKRNFPLINIYIYTYIHPLQKVGMRPLRALIPLDTITIMTSDSSAGKVMLHARTLPERKAKVNNHTDVSLVKWIVQDYWAVSINVYSDLRFYFTLDIPTNKASRCIDQYESCRKFGSAYSYSFTILLMLII